MGPTDVLLMVPTKIQEQVKSTIGGHEWKDLQIKTSSLPCFNSITFYRSFMQYTSFTVDIIDVYIAEMMSHEICIDPSSNLTTP